MSVLAGELAAIGRRAGGSRALLISDQEKTEIYTAGRNGSWESIATWTGQLADSAPFLEMNLARRLRQRLGVRFHSQQTVMRRIVLPAGVQSVVEAIIRNKVEALAPWPLQEAVWGYRVSELPDDADYIAVDVAVIGRGTIDSLMSTAARAGAVVTSIDVGTSADDGNAIPIEFDGKRSSTDRKRWIAVLLLATALAAFLSDGYDLILGFSVSEELAGTESRIAVLAASLHGTSQATGISAKLETANGLYARKLEYPPLTSVLDALTTLVPDDIWLSGIVYNTDKLTILGQGKNIPALVDILERSAMFKDVNFVAATQRNVELDQDEFSISATIEHREPSP